MTRKRFVKLLMSRGYSRNEANSRARAAVSAGFTYDCAYFAVRVETGESEALEAVQAVLDRIVQVVKSWTETMWRLSKAIKEALPSMEEMIHRNAAEE